MNTQAGYPARGMLAAVLIGVLLAGCASQRPGRDQMLPPGRETAARSFTDFTITRTGGIAGISQRIGVSPDGTVRNATGQPIGRLSAADLAELRTLLTGQEIGREAARPNTGASRCADGFTFTLVMKELRVSDYACGRPVDKPAFNRVLELTSAGHLNAR